MLSGKVQTQIIKIKFCKDSTKKRKKTNLPNQPKLQKPKNQNTLKASSPVTGISTKEPTKTATASKESNQVSSKRPKRSTSKTTKLSKLSLLISLMITSLASTKVKSRLKSLANILSVLLQTMDQDFGSMKRKSLITGVFTEPKKEKEGFTSNPDTTMLELSISKMQVVHP